MTKLKQRPTLLLVLAFSLAVVGFAVFAYCRGQTNTGASLDSVIRYSAAGGAPTCPMPRYSRVLPLESVVTAISARSVKLVLGGSAMGRKICCQVFPPSIERHKPFA